MQPFSVRARREAEAWAAVAAVNDPELDEPVTEMGFVERIDVGEDGAVDLDFRLPTYWCSPNFAFLMLDGVRAALDALPWRPRARITLHDHLFAEEVNQGLAAGKRFEDIFAELAPGEDLEALKLKFRMKAFQRRQEALIATLRDAGWPTEDIVGLKASGLAADQPAVARYREAFHARFPDADADAPAIVDWSGAAIGLDGFADHVARLRAVRINMEFNGALCRGLKQVRYREKAAGADELTLVDFLAPKPGFVEHSGDGTCRN
jgi:metal-sulfur cluster biosynthetic enzyme